MATVNCDFKRAGSERKSYWHLVIPALALLFQLVPPVLFRAISEWVYAEPRRLSEIWERPVSLLALGLSASISLLLGGIGVYGLLTRSRLWLAVLLIVVCCTPALLGGAAYLHGLLVFLALV